MANKKISNATAELIPTYRDAIPIAHTTDGSTYTPEKVTQQDLTKLRIVSKTSVYTVDPNDDVVLCDATGGVFTVNLPTAVGIAGVKKTIKKIDASGNAITVDPNGAQTIDGAATQLLSTQWAKVTVMSDGVNWQTV